MKTGFGHFLDFVTPDGLGIAYNDGSNVSQHLVIITGHALTD